ncbi:MAG: adenosylcobinamide-GDP ribazoletransferase [Bacteroides sp.]|nr:adenosylcobinamide-GDP ribazoletransferase [Bacteroides sp.]
MKKILAAIDFFTRLPAWRICSIPPRLYKRVVELWPLAGWVTGGLTALAICLAMTVFPPFVSVTIGFAFRILLTGALHEDGLADFADGFGGGTSRRRILEIMKDSSIGSYGTLTLIFYVLLLIATVSFLPARWIPPIVAAADPWSKSCAAQLINFLPYARKESEAKNRTVYERMSASALALCLICGAVPAVCVSWLQPPLLHPLLISALAPVCVIILMILYLRHKLGGYTGDCCGASAMLCELAFYLTALATVHIHTATFHIP